MQFTLLRAALAGLALLLMLPATAAQAAPVPPGSYMATCVNARMDGPMLIARCRTTYGAWNVSAVNVFQCRPGGDISNQNGNLSCPPGRPMPPPGPPPGWRLPPGSYRATCTNEYMQGPFLNAMCLDVRGIYRRAALDVRNCRGPVANANGSLVCNF